MVNTRRIGGKPLSPVVGPGVSIGQRETNQPTELIGAVKATGQVGGLRYGVLGAFEEEVKALVAGAVGLELMESYRPGVAFNHESRYY